MSSGCGDFLSLEDLKTAKKHQTFEAEVITGLSGGAASGEEIDTATNAVTGQVQKTLPAILRDLGFNPVAFDFTTGGTLAVSDRDAVVFNPADNNWYSWSGALPHVVAAGADPTADSNWMPRTDQLLRQDLGSGEKGMGAYLSAYQRQWALELISNVATYLNAGKINLWEYRHLAIDTVVSGAEVVDWTLALTQALIDSATYKRQVYAPGGRYYFRKMSEFVNLDTSGSTTNMSIYSLTGDGHDKTIFWTDSTDGREMHFSSCRVYFDHYSVQRVLSDTESINQQDAALPLMQLGRNDTSSAVRLSYIGDVRFNGSPWGFNIEHVWDSIFDKLIVHNFRTIGIRIGTHSIDNSNNLLFIRPHIESCLYTGTNLCRAFANMSGPGGTTRNHGMTLIQPHIEPVNFRCHHLYLSYGQNIKVINPQFNRNNSSNAELSLPATQAVPLIYSSDGVNIHIDGGQIQHIGTRSDDVPSVMKFAGTHKGFRCDSYIDTGKATTRTDLTTSLDIASSNGGLREISFRGATINSFTTMSSVGDRLRVAPLNDLQKVFDLVAEAFIPPGETNTIARIAAMYSNTQDLTTPQQKVWDISSAGHASFKALRGQQFVIQAGATSKVDVGVGALERRGTYLISGVANNNQLFAMFFNVPGQTPVEIKTGSSVNLSIAPPAASVTDKLCVYQNNQYISLENRTASAVTVNVNFFA